ncbi:MAG: hypothetical protein R6W78_13090 [Bacteroidales bacterium]
MSWRSTEANIVGARWAADGEQILVELDNGKAVLLDKTGDDILRCETDARDAASTQGTASAKIHQARDGRAWLYLVAAEDLISLACSRATRNLSPDEWQRYLGADVPYRATCPNLLPAQP